MTVPTTAGLTLSDFDAMLKDYYTADRIEQMIYADNPFLALIKKVEKFGGRAMPIPVVYANAQSRSATFSQAQTTSGDSSGLYKSFDLTRVSDYGIITIDTETLEASEGDEGAFLDAKTSEIDGIINSLTRSLAIGMYRSGWGALGVCGSTTTSTVTLATISDAHNFEVGMQLVAAATEQADELRGGTGYVTVTGVNRNTGVITAGSTWTTDITSFAAGDVIFARGDRTTVAAGKLKVAGLEAWAPVSAPASTAFFGVDRTADSRLYGVSYNGASDDVSDAIITGVSRCAALGHKIDHVFMSFTKYAQLEQELQDSVRYVDLKGPGEIGFRGIVLNGPRGPVKVIADQNCPSTRAFGVQLSNLALYSIGKAIRPISGDGLQMLRQSANDGVEVRYGFKGNLGCRMPSSIVNIQL